MISNSDKQLFKNYLKDYLSRYHGITNTKKFFRCLNPNHTDNNPSMHYSERYKICKCFSCLVRYDIFDLIAIDYGITNFKDQYNKLAELYNKCDMVINTETEVKEIDNLKNYSKYFDYCFRKISKSSYLTDERKINFDLLIKYRVGYDEERKIVIFPLNDNSYFARSTVGKNKYKSKGTSYLFNENLIKNNDENTIIYVTESIIDALSLETIKPDLKVIALNGITNIQRFLKLVEENDYKGAFILALDNDYFGKNAQDTLKKELDKLNITSFSNSLITSIDDVKDINEALIKHKEKLVKSVNYLDEQYNKIFEKLKLRRDIDFEIIR